MNHLSRAIKNTAVMILAGGEGERLSPLTRDRAKPAVPFAGNLRLIDFTLSNCLNSGLRRIHVLTQYKSDSLNRHVRLGWNLFNPELGEYIEVNPPQLRLASTWYLGTADAIYQNIYTLQREEPDYVLILSGDHVYRMDYSRLIEHHIGSGAELTIACKPAPLPQAVHLGVVTADPAGRVLHFKEKPNEPVPMQLPERFGPPAQEHALCSMGVYVFNTETLVRKVIDDSKLITSHDFGHDVIPRMIESGVPVAAFRFWDSERGKLLYWRDIGTLDAYLKANLELAAGLCDDPLTEPLDLYDREWPFRSYVSSSLPLNILCSPHAPPDIPLTTISNSLISNGVVIRDASVSNSVISPGVRIGQGSVIEKSVLLPDVVVGDHVEIYRAIIDKHNCIPSGARIGVDRSLDQQRFTISEDGVVAVPKHMPMFHGSRRAR